MNDNRVEYGLKNVHFAPMTSQSTFATPIHMPGAASIKLSPVNETIEEELYHGDISYCILNKGYTGTLNLALIPDEFSLSCLCFKEENEMIVESTEPHHKAFALLFEFDGDSQKTRHILYNCIASRTDLESETKSSNNTITTNSIPLRVLPYDFKKIVKAKVKQESSKYDTWFNEITII